MRKSIACLATALSAQFPLLTLMAYEEIKPLDHYALHYQCTSGHRVSLTYKSLDDIPSGGWGYNGKMMVDGQVFEASYYFYGAQAFRNGQPSYPSFQGRGQPKGVGILWLGINNKDTCVEVN